MHNQNVDAHLGPSPHTAKETYQNIFGRKMANTWKARASNDSTIKNQTHSKKPPTKHQTKNTVFFVKILSNIDKLQCKNSKSRNYYQINHHGTSFLNLSTRSVIPIRY